LKALSGIAERICATEFRDAIISYHINASSSEARTPSPALNARN